MTLDLWFVLLFVGGLVAAVFTRSLLLNLAVVLVSVLGINLARNLDASDTVVYGLIVMFVLVIVFCLMQLLRKVDKV